MKKTLQVLALLFISLNMFAQAPQKMSYQAVIRNSVNNLVTNAPVKMRISILQGSASGTTVYSELHNPTTNANGLVSIEIGSGTSPVGTIGSINWGNGIYFLKTETDPTNGTNYSIVGTSQLLSVPYAFFSGNGIPGNGGQNQTLSWCNGTPTWGPCIPQIQTTNVSNITHNSATTGGNIINNGGNVVISRGVVWGITSGPTIALSTKTSDGTGSGSFSSSVTSLLPNTTYYVRAYATNSAGTGYGNELSFTTKFKDSITDVDGNKYEVLQICNQIWMTQNLNVSKYRNGDVIPQVQDPTQWANLTTGAWCYYVNSTTDGPKFGKLYNWYAVNDPRGLAPQGYHIPNDAEWLTLINCLGGASVAGGKMKAVSGLWRFPNTGATNSSGFNGLPYGTRYNDGNWGPTGYGADWWSSSSSAPLYAPIINLAFDLESVTNRVLAKQQGIYVRCVKD